MNKENNVEPFGPRTIQASVPDHQARAKCILLFERGEDDARMFSMGADQADCQFVVWTVDAEDAHENARTLSLYMIVLGCNRAGHDELELLRQLRENNHLDDIPIIIFSEVGSEDDVRLAFELGADRFFLKPPLEEHYIACSKAIVAQEANLDTTTMEYEQFPIECEVYARIASRDSCHAVTVLRNADHE